MKVKFYFLKLAYTPYYCYLDSKRKYLVRSKMERCVDYVFYRILIFCAFTFRRMKFQFKGVNAMQYPGMQITLGEDAKMMHLVPNFKLKVYT